MNGRQGNALPEGNLLKQQYRVEKVLGIGGFGITYLARDTLLDYKIAIKEYLPGELAYRNANNTVHPRSPTLEYDFRWGLNNFLKEARTLAKFKHSNIVRVYNFFEANDTAYMVMEYEEGENLSAYLDRVGTLDETEIRKVLFPILEGLEVLHENSVIHRDIKPSNILLRTDGTPLLLDFGSARNLNSDRDLTVVVSPRYSPPEQFDSEERQGPWTDIYALGLVLYRIITDKAPIDTQQRVEAVRQNRPDPLTPAAEVGKERFSPPFLFAIDWATNLEKRDRPQSIQEWRQKLKEVDTGGNGNLTAPAELSLSSRSAQGRSEQWNDSTVREIQRDDTERSVGPGLAAEKRGIRYWVRWFLGIGPASDQPGRTRSDKQLGAPVDAEIDSESESGDTSDSVMPADDQAVGAGSGRRTVASGQMPALSSSDSLVSTITVFKDAKPAAVTAEPVDSYHSLYTAAGPREFGGESEEIENVERRPVREVPSGTNAQTSSDSVAVGPEKQDSEDSLRHSKAEHQDLSAVLPGSMNEGETDEPKSTVGGKLEQRSDDADGIWRSASSPRVIDSKNHQFFDVFNAHRSSGRGQDDRVVRDPKLVGDSSEPPSRPWAQPENQPNRAAGIWEPTSSQWEPDLGDPRSSDVFGARRSSDRRHPGGDIFSSFAHPRSRESKRLPPPQPTEPKTIDTGQEENSETTSLYSAQVKAAVHVSRGNSLYWGGQEKEALEQWQLAMALVPVDKDLTEKIERLRRRLDGSVTVPEPSAPDNEGKG